MKLNKVLNKKQSIVGWVMILSISAVIARTIFVLHFEPYLGIKLFLRLYSLIFVFGLLIIHALRDNKKGKTQAA
jgi:hypothetical protein